MLTNILTQHPMITRPVLMTGSAILMITLGIWRFTCCLHLQDVISTFQSQMHEISLLYYIH